MVDFGTLGIVAGAWQPERSDDYERDNQLGRSLALELERVIGRERNPALFGTVIRAITQAGRFEAVEVGFCSHFGIMLLGLR